jgi:hypothetical protein
MSAIATNTPTNCSVEKKIRKPPRLAAPAVRMMGVLAPMRSASQPHRLGARMRMTCMSDMTTAMSAAVKPIDER